MRRIGQIHRTFWAAVLGFAVLFFGSLGAPAESAPAFQPEPPAPAGAVVLGQSQKPGWADAPAVGLGPGDWSIFLASRAPKGNQSTGTLLSIGDASDTLFTDKGHLTITWCSQYSGPWQLGHFGGSFVVTAVDDNGVSVAQRRPSASTFFGVPNVHPLVGHAMADDRVHGLVVQCRGGVVEFWSVEEAGARLMDAGSVSSKFGGIAAKPLRIGAANLVKQPQWPFTYWRQPLQGLAINQGGCLTPVQMSRLFRGADAGALLGLKAERGDRYYPGTVKDGKLVDVVGGQDGAAGENGLSQAASILPESVTDDVLVKLEGNGQVLPVEGTGETSKIRFWGTRVGAPADIRLRVIDWREPSKVVVGWVTVAKAVGNGQAWAGDVPGVPRAFADYDCEVSWKDGSGGWTAPKRLYRRWSAGVVIALAGQSIIQTMRDMGGPQRSFDPSVGGFLRAYYDPSQGTSGYEDNGSPQGWSTRYTPSAPKTSRDNYGEARLAEKLALLAKCPVGIGNFAVGGAPIRTFLGESDRWERWKRFIQRDRPPIAVWGNGQGDSALSREKRFAYLDELLARFDDAVKTAPGGPWPYKFLVFPLNGDWGLMGGADSIRSYDMEWAKQRAAEGKPVGIVCFALDEKTADGTHPSAEDTGNGVIASRMAQTFANVLGFALYSGLGPSWDATKSAWKAGDGVTTVTLALVQNGGKALVTAGGGAPSGFRVRLDDGKFEAPASAAILDATHVVLTVNGVAAKSVSVTYLAGSPGSPGKRQNTTKAEAGLDNALYDDRGDEISGLPGYPAEPITWANPLVLKVP